MFREKISFIQFASLTFLKAVLELVGDGVVQGAGEVLNMVDASHLIICMKATAAYSRSVPN